ncbi:DUF4422 domain-containing protein [Caproiciproducens sp. LBM24188]
MINIRIFVSRRLDIDSLNISNPLYIPVHCGAFRQSITSPYLGDNTGDNISEKQPYYSELTVQYWAWKNQQADYYGLCHYRRYLSFSDKRYRTNEQNMVVEPILSPGAIRRHKLMDSSKMQSVISKYDAIVSESADVTKIPIPSGGFPKTVRELWEGHNGVFIYKKDLNVLLQVIHDLHPEYMDSALKYLSGSAHRGYNCYILRRDLFFTMCQFQFDVLDELERRIDISTYQGNLKRVFGYMGEIMYGIYIYDLQQKGIYKVQELQLVYFEETRQLKNFMHRVWLIALAYLTFALRHSSEIILPKGSVRREKVKKFIKRLRGI